jgi:Domain of unknown function (DUF2017)
MAEFRASPVADGVRLELSGEAERALREVLAMLSEKIINGDSKLRRRMFPDAYDRPAWANDFRHDHEEGMRNTVCDAIDRVLERWPGVAPVVLDDRGVDDWYLVLTHARMLYIGRRAANLAQRAAGGDEVARNVLWLSHAQRELLRAAVPDLG